jgi:rSAM/selenodomain-associated transferase 1
LPQIEGHGVIFPTNGQAFESNGSAGASHGSCAIGVMAKTPRPGFSKTRLCPPLRPEQAAALSAAFLRDTTTNIAQAALSVPVAGYAAYAPSGTEEALISHVAEGTVCVLADGSAPVPQGVEGFGRCLLHAIQQMFAAGHAAACVLSSDTPTLPTQFLVTAVSALLAGNHRRVVLGACDDGGYYLLGMRFPHAWLFADIAWSTSSVAATTRTRAAELGLDLVELPPWYDVDDAAALERLVRDSAGYDALWTRQAIQMLGLETFTHPQCTI